MEAKYTPGPWRLQKDRVTIDAGNGNHVIARAKEVTMCRSEREANAQLMSAAPELLEALERVTKQATPILARMDPILGKAIRDAIAKAKEGI